MHQCAFYMCSFGSLQHLLKQRRVKRGEKKKPCRVDGLPLLLLSCPKSPLQYDRRSPATHSRVKTKETRISQLNASILGTKKEKKNTFSNLSFPSSLKDLFAACEASICTWLSFIVSVPDSNKHRRGESSFSPAVSLSLFFFITQRQVLNFWSHSATC